ncbi:MAG: hypothetical protein DRN07_02000 [Thermoplasmata archaeon]|nr:MAG: hypothetical protein DRN07_02000 [Thermoplasmata archaeon]
METILGRERLGYTIQGKPELDHTLIVIDAKDDEIIFFDTFTPFLHINEKNSPERAIFKLGKGLFLQLWTDALTSFRWAMWVEKTPQKVMEEFGEIK